MVENSELRKAGLKVTLPRVKILQMLEDASGDILEDVELIKTLGESKVTSTAVNSRG